MNLIIQYYNDGNPQRMNEYIECLKYNLENPAIKCIHNIMEPFTILSREFINKKKLINIPFNYSHSGTIKGRLTFKYAFDYALKNIPHGEVVCILNLDIFLDISDSWNSIKQNFFDINSDVLKMICLSRHEYNPSKKNYKIESCQSSGASTDAWIFLNPIKTISDCNFAVGNAPGCDAAIARRFYNAGYTIFNWPQKYKIIHYDLCRGHNNGKMIITNKTDKEAGRALLRGRLDCSPDQAWDVILKLNRKPSYKLTN